MHSVSGFGKLPAIALAIAVGGCLDSAFAQGCVAIRNHGGSDIPYRGEVKASASYRYFESFRHFRGDEEEPQRVEENTEVINSSHSLDLVAAYGVTPRISLNLDLPLLFNRRSSLYEHDRANRHTTGSMGLGDPRVGAAWVVFDPSRAPRGNAALGLGLKVPLGDHEVKDEFHTAAGAVTRPVDQSIQLGDGGWGFSLEAQGSWSFRRATTVYAGGFYLFNPGNTNGTPTGRRDTLGTSVSTLSIPDQYMARAGFAQGLPGGLRATLGLRVEGIPAEDVLGKSGGFRRPGLVVSAEPGVGIAFGKSSLNLHVPTAIYRNRVKSVADRITGGHGDAAFADYLVLLGYSLSFGRPGSGI